MVEQNRASDRTVERTRTNADPCHSCHAAPHLWEHGRRGPAGPHAFFRSHVPSAQVGTAAHLKPNAPPTGGRTSRTPHLRPHFGLRALRAMRRRFRSANFRPRLGAECDCVTRIACSADAETELATLEEPP